MFNWWLIEKKKKAKELKFHVQLTSSKVSLIWEDNGKLTSNKTGSWGGSQDGLSLFQSTSLYPCSLYGKGVEGEAPPWDLPAINFPRRLQHNPSWSLQNIRSSSLRTNSLTLHLPWKYSLPSGWGKKKNPKPKTEGHRAPYTLHKIVAWETGSKHDFKKLDITYKLFLPEDSSTCWFHSE